MENTISKLNYVLKTNEGVAMPAEKSIGFKIMQILVWSVAALIIVGSIFLHENLFMELSMTTRILLIILVLEVFFRGLKKQMIPSPIELWFYDDHILFYLPQRPYSRKFSRKEFVEMNYADITKCVYKKNSERIHIYGNGTSRLYNYNRDGTVPETPTHVINFTDGLMYFNIEFAKDIDFKKEIETHSPLKLMEENS